MAKRFEADYDDFVFIDESKIEGVFAETEEFIAMLITIIHIKF